jgi:hypothetical protein
MAKAKTNTDEAEIEAVANTSVATVKAHSVPAEYDYGDYAGAGFENSTSEDFAVPFLHVLQSNSVAVEAGEEVEVNGTMVAPRAGMIINTVTGRLYEADGNKNKPGVLFVPATTQHLYVEWKTRDNGGGYVGQHLPTDRHVMSIIQNQDFGKFKMGDNDLIETYYVYGLNVDEITGEFEQAIVAFTSTKIKVFKAWHSRKKIMRIPGLRATLPLFSHIWRLNTEGQKNSKGSYYNLKFSLGKGNEAASRLMTSSELFQSAAMMNEAFKDGAIKANVESLGGAGGGTVDAEVAGGGDEGNEIPF